MLVVGKVISLAHNAPLICDQECVRLADDGLNSLGRHLATSPWVQLGSPVARRMAAAVAA